MTWKTGRRPVAERAHGASHSLEEFIATVEPAQPVRALGAAVFMTAQPTGTLPALAHNLRHNKVLHKRGVVLTVATAQVPHVPNEERLAVQLSDAICSTSASSTGSRRTRTSPKRWSQPREQGLKLDAEDVTYFLGREAIIVTHLEGMAVWREKVSVLMARNAVRATVFFRLPPERVVELGV